MPFIGGRFGTIVSARMSRLIGRAELPAETLGHGYESRSSGRRTVVMPSQEPP